MLTKEDSERLARVGPGTPMGELLRRYWMPIGALTEFDKITSMPIALLGEDLVLYKDLQGTYGLIDRHCAHRRADLSYGFVEACGLRCNYHGWRFDETGRCLEQPYDDIAAAEARFKDRVRIKSYPVDVRAGLIWAYLGLLLRLCRTGNRSHGRTDSARSSSPKCHATGFSVRKTRSIPFTSNGCT